MALFPTRTFVASAKLVTLIEVSSRHGTGTNDEDPVREIVEYFQFDGTKVAEFDPVKTEAFQNAGKR